MTTSGTARTLLGFAAFLQAAGGAIHAAAFGHAVKAIAGTALPALFAGAFKALWLADSTTMFSLAIIFTWIAIRPIAASRAFVMLLALIPAGVGVLIYVFLGGFFAGHLLAATAVLVVIAGRLLPGAPGASLPG